MYKITPGTIYRDISIFVKSFNRYFSVVRVDIDERFICFFDVLYLLVQQNIFPGCFHPG